MIIYNVTVKISNEKHDDWLDWMKNKHIPDVLATGKFEHHVFSKVMVEDDEGVNYSIQYHCQDFPTLQDYQDNHAPPLQEEHSLRYKDHFVAFRTILEIVE